MDYRGALAHVLSFADFEGSGSFQDRPDVEPVRPSCGWTSSMSTR